MANLTTTEANNILNASSGQAAFTAVSGALGTQKVQLETSTGTASAAGTAVSGGSYAAQQITFTAASGGSITSGGASGTLTYTTMPACTVTYVSEFDANMTTRRWFGALQASKTVNAGDTFTIAAGSYTKTLS